MSGARTSHASEAGRSANRLIGVAYVLIWMLFFLASGSVQAQQQQQGSEQSQASYSALADLLENPQTRDQLIQQLRSLAAPEGGQQGAQEEAADDQTPLDGLDESQSVGGQIADATQRFAQGLAADFGEAIRTLRELGSGQGISGVSVERWIELLTGLVVVVVAIFAAFFVLRGLAALLYRRIDRWIADRPHVTVIDESREAETGRKRRVMSASTLLGRLAAVFGSLGIDILVVMLAGAVGYSVGLFGVGLNGDIGRMESLFINAFVVVEISKALVRMIFATRYPNLRLFPMDDQVARYWNRWMARLIGVSGYGLLVVVPLARAIFSPAVGQTLNLLIMVGVFIYAVAVILKNRAVIGDRLKQHAATVKLAPVATLERMLARTWHLFAILYFVVLLVISQLSPAEALPFMARATLQTLLAVGLGLLVSALLTSALSKRILLSDELRARLPKLEMRLNSYVPAALRAIRMLLTLFVVLAVLDAWHVFDLSAWLASPAGGDAIAVVLHVALILFFAALVWTVLASVIEHRLSGVGGKAPSAREQTLLALFRNAMLIVIVTMTLLIVLSQIGINIAPLIAGAGVVGLAIGFGAQKLVQDIITGVFIQLENGMNQNDVVEAGGVFGTVERLTIRSVGIRTLDGGYHLIPFSSVDTVTNHMRDFSYHMGEYTISHRESVDDAIRHLEHAFEELQQDPVLAPSILEEMTIPGVVAIDERGVRIRILIKTSPGMQWAVQRGFNRLVKKHFNAANIEIPYPQTVVHFGQDKNGNAPPLRVTEAEAERLAEGTAPAPGQTPRALTRAKAGQSEDVLGNELEGAEEGDDDAPPR
ncbi:mechanosensitive ion channel domain-containing protein [Halotalea alkalilenta]|uniref:mechanosensitive ion channel domain-containing protein n=1 Tax=Halotalea alkalilenta TaxID=376489 RepID=UPI000B02FABD|nr:mechanosensitive ion channel domain-containing protein [Halotalea alkalilenta]